MDKELKKLTNKERKEYLKSLHEKQAGAGQRNKHLVRIVILLGIFAILGIALYLYFKPAAPRPNIGQSFPEQGRSHIAEGSTDHAPYNSNPPSSGNHWSTPAICKVYDQEVPDEAVVHSLEHGAVWLSYKDKNDKDLAKKLENIAKSSGGKILVSPREKNDSKIAVVSWGRVLKLEKIDEKKIKEFIRYYRNTAPEGLASC